METTALGAAYLAGLAAGLCPDLETFSAWRPDRRFAPAMAPAAREEKYRGWQDAVRRNLQEST
jgi:glycerol kinase